MDSAFLELMPLTGVLNRYTGEDDFGNNTYGVDVTFRCRAEQITRTMDTTTQGAGTAVAAPGRSVRVYMDITSPVVAQGDKVTVAGVVYRVVTATVEYDETGPYYQELVCENNKE